MVSRRLCMALLGLFILGVFGCENKHFSFGPRKPAKKKSVAAKKDPQKEEVKKPLPGVKPEQEFDEPTAFVRAEDQSVDAFVREIGASARHGKTLAVWLIDQSTSANTMRLNVAARLDETVPKLFTDLGGGEGGDAPLVMAVVAFGKETKFVTDDPVDTAEAFMQAINAVEEDPSGAENTFAALNAAAEKFLPADGRTATFCLVTNEAGDDWTQVEATIPVFRKQQTPVYVIGLPAPFGPEAGLPSFTEAGLDPTAGFGKVMVRTGPESRHPERITLGFTGGAGDADLADSGFGPFGLSWLAKETYGRFLAVRAAQTEGGLWEGMGVKSFEIDPQTMRDYEPDYVSEADYQKILNASKAAMALHLAARLPKADVLGNPTSTFVKKSEAEFVTALTMAQRDAAVVEKNINIMYDTLIAGERDRTKLPSKRWKAGYDLALGRIMAAKARSDGYNLMLAAMKAGKNFEDPGSTTWMIQPSEKVSAGSVVEKMAAKSRSYLQDIVKDHPGTPWAVVAERDLQNLVGWEWSER